MLLLDDSVMVASFLPLSCVTAEDLFVFVHRPIPVTHSSLQESRGVLSFEAGS